MRFWNGGRSFEIRHCYALGIDQIWRSGKFWIDRFELFYQYKSLSTYLRYKNMISSTVNDSEKDKNSKTFDFYRVLKIKKKLNPLSFLNAIINIVAQVTVKLSQTYWQAVSIHTLCDEWFKNYGQKTMCQMHWNALYDSYNWWFLWILAIITGIHCITKWS